MQQSKKSLLLIWQKLLLVCVAFWLASPPITHMLNALLLLIFLIALSCSQPLNKQIFKKLCIVLIIVFSGYKLIPQQQIEIGYNLYLPTHEVKNANLNQLPLLVKNSLRDMFYRYHPPSSWPDKVIPREEDRQNWRQAEMNGRTFAYSTESFWHPTPYSKIVDYLDFDSLNMARIGTINDNSATLGKYNWYPSNTKIRRENVPFFMRISLSSDLLNSQLCWQGVGFWEAQKINHTHKTCHVIKQDDMGKAFYGVSFPDDSPLSLTLKPTKGWHWLNCMKQLFLTLSFLLLICLIQPPWPVLKQRLCLLSICLVVIGIQVTFHLNHSIINALNPMDWISNLQLFKQTLTLGGGGDGLAYQAYGREMTYWLGHGEWIKALRGGTDVFYYMPGMRYFRMIDNLLFGESSLGMLLILLICFIQASLLIQRVFHERWVIFTLTIFFTLLSGHFVKYGLAGYGELITYTCFFAAISYLLKKPTTEQAVWGSLLFGIGILIRPNTLFGALFPMAYWAYVQYQTGYKKAILGLLGFSLVSLALLHNLFFNHTFTPFTNSAFIDSNFKVHPNTYWQALVHFNAHAWHVISAHFREWFKDPLRILGIMAVLLTVSPCLNRLEKVTMFFIDPWKKAVNQYRQNENKQHLFNVKIMAWSALGLHLPSLFWSVSSRYTYFAWVLSVLVLISIVNILGMPKKKSYNNTLR